MPKFNLIKRQTLARVAAVLMVSSMGVAQAAVDLTDIEGAGADIALVGAAVFAVAVGIKLFKWIRRAL